MQGLFSKKQVDVPQLHILGLPPIMDQNPCGLFILYSSGTVEPGRSCRGQMSTGKKKKPKDLTSAGHQSWNLYFKNNPVNTQFKVKEKGKSLPSEWTLARKQDGGETLPPSRALRRVENSSFLYLHYKISHISVSRSPG